MKYFTLFLEVVTDKIDRRSLLFQSNFETTNNLLLDDNDHV